MKNIIAFFIFLFFYQLSFAQHHGEHDSTTSMTFDRPGIADSPYTIDKRLWQIEAGFDYSKGSELSDSFYPTILLRKSVSKKLEIRFSIDYQPVNQYISKYYEEHESHFPLSLMAKYKLWEGKKWLPDAAVMGGVVAPLHLQKKLIHLDTISNHLSTEFYLLFQNNITRHFSINYNLGYLGNYHDTNNFYDYAVCFNINPSEKIGLFIENYAYFKSFKEAEQGLDAGVVYMLLPNLQVDFSGGMSWFRNESYHFLSLGFSLAIQ